MTTVRTIIRLLRQLRFTIDLVTIYVSKDVVYAMVIILVPPTSRMELPWPLLLP